MSYEDAYRAFQRGDFQAALPLLERAVRETDYVSPALNHAYTLTLYQVGDRARLADVAVHIGHLFVPTDPAMAMDYFQRALDAGLDAKRARSIGEVFENWAVPRQLAVRLKDPLSRVAHVIGSLSPEKPLSQYLQMLVSSLRKQGIESTMFNTESTAAWFCNSADTVEGDFNERAERVAETLRTSGIPVAFFHANLADQITARVASLRPVSVQINVNHGSEMDADLFDGRVHLFQNAMRRSRFDCPAEWIPPVADIAHRVPAHSMTRHAMGLDSASSISATFGNLDEMVSSEYLRVLSELMTRFSKHFHLFAGAGNLKRIRPYLHARGVLPRVRFLGDIRDVSALLDVVDVYLASFPRADWDSILRAMGATRPVVVLQFPPDSPNNAAAELVSEPALIANNEADWIRIADGLLRDVDLRRKLGQSMADRCRVEFHPDRLGERYKDFLARFQHASG